MGIVCLPCLRGKRFVVGRRGRGERRRLSRSVEKGRREGAGNASGEAEQGETPSGVHDALRLPRETRPEGGGGAGTTRRSSGRILSREGARTVPEGPEVPRHVQPSHAAHGAPPGEVHLRQPLHKDGPRLRWARGWCRNGGGSSLCRLANGRVIGVLR